MPFGNFCRLLNNNFTVHFQEQLKERQVREILEKDLSDKDKQLQELLNKHQEVIFIDYFITFSISVLISSKILISDRALARGLIRNGYDIRADRKNAMPRSICHIFETGKTTI